MLPTDTSDGMLRALAAPGEMLGYMARYLGPPVASDDVRTAFGLLLLIPGTVLVVRGLLRGESNRFAAFHLALVAFGLAVAFLTALARVKAGIGTAGGSRYAAFSMLYWVGLLSLTGFHLAQARHATGKAGLYGACAAAFLLLILPTQSVLIAPFVQKAERSAAAALSLVTGVPDRDLIGRYLHPRIDKVVDLVPLLRARNFGFFGSPLVRSLGQPARQSYGSPVGDCPAALASMPLGGGVRVTGRFSGGEVPDQLVLVDLQDIVVGLGLTNRRGREFTLYGSSLSGTVYGVTEEGLCRAGELN